MSKDHPHNPNDPHECEEHEHHAGCQHGKQRLPITNKVKIGRNDPCICGSGKKYKKCCLNH